MAQALTREAIPEPYRWNLADLFPSPEDWEAERQALLAELPKLEALRGTLHQGPQQVLQVLQFADELDQRVSKLFAYALLARDEDTRVPEAAQRYEQAVALAVAAGRAGAWITPELLSFSDDELRAMLEAEPRLAPFRRAIEQAIRSRPHTRSAEVEELLAASAQMAQATGNAFHFLDNADITYGTVVDEDGSTVEVTKARYRLLLERRDRRVRQAAYEVFNAPYLAHQHTFAALLSGSVQRDAFYAYARRYPSALHAALEPENIPVELYSTLIQAVRDHLPVLYRYFALRKQVLGLDRLRMYDLVVPLVLMPPRRYTYDEAREIVLAALQPLGEDYVQALAEGLAARWVDVYETPGKRSGGYSLGVYGVHPYILLNWGETQRDVFTLAHEVGHAMHSLFSSRTQPHPTAEYTIFVAEVASTVNERLLTAALLERADDPQMRAALLTDSIETFRTTVYRQTMFAEFERWLHEVVERGEGVSADRLCRQYAELVAAYHGPDVEVDAQVAVEWSRIPHFYRAFYVYQYATGLIAATALADAIRAGEPGARERYLTFLSSGSAKDSLDLLRDAGVDLLASETYERAFGVFAQEVTALESALRTLGLLPADGLSSEAH
ncbi:oligoendopeptidase F [Thermorudis peleae]|uniref:oligoendopeptidase F n=1 Tax=Thermorudis peleae TaxID=1382356 RepID=UPI00056DBAF3|nr:oligoendopeptidase F [Thermorudis peleae]